MGWATLLKSGAKFAGKGLQLGAELTGKAICNPGKTIKAAGTAVKTAAVGGALGYVGWHKLTSDDSVVEIVSDALVGEKTTDAISNTIHGTTEGVKELREQMGTMTQSVTQTMQGVDNRLNGISNFIGQISNGDGGQMLGNFMNNLTSGNVKGMGVMGLVLSAFLLFGRFGWMGKLAGAVLAMMTIGNNAYIQRPQAIQSGLESARGSRQSHNQIQQESHAIQEHEVEQIHRARR